MTTVPRGLAALRRPARVSLVVLAGLVAAIAPSTVAAGAETVRGFTAHAWAQGARTTYAMPGYLILDTLADVGSPVADALLSSAGDGAAFAAVPYPGETVTAAPGLAGLSAVPQPYFVSAQYPARPRAQSDAPGGLFALRALAGDVSTSALAETRHDVGTTYASRLSASAAVDQRPDGSVVASSVSLARGLTFGGVLRIAEVTATSRTVRSPGGHAVTTTSIQVRGAEALGVPVQITTDGVAVGSTQAAVPESVSGAVRSALAKAGVTARTSAGSRTADGGAADALVVTVDTTAPVPGDPPARLTYRIGGASTSVVSGAATSAPPGRPGVADDQSDADAGPRATAPALAAQDAAAGPMPERGPAPVGDASHVATRQRALAVAARFGLASLYAVLVAAGVLGVVTAVMWRRRESDTWTF